MITAPQIKRILFTTDLSKETRQAFNYAVGLAFQYGAGLTILYVMEEVPQVHGEDFVDFLGKERWAEVRQSHEQEIRQLLIGKKREGSMIRSALEEMLSAAQDDMGPNRSHASDQVVVTQGDVVDCILHEIQANEIDLLVMGYHARGRLEEAIAGSVSRSVLRKVQVPVLLVKLP
jgi:nucleotide-binding universal stress UspA family protein